MSPIQLFVLNHESKSYNTDLNVEKKSPTWPLTISKIQIHRKKTTSIFFGQNVIENKKDLYSRAWLFVKIYHTSNIASYFKHNFHRICKNCTNLWSDIVFSLRSQGFYNRVPLKSWRHLGEGSSVEPTVHGDCSVVGSRLTTICLWIWILSQFQKAEEKTKS